MDMHWIGIDVSKAKPTQGVLSGLRSDPMHTGPNGDPVSGSQAYASKLAQPAIRRHLRELLHARADDVHALHQLFLRDDQRRREPDDVAVGGLGEQAVVAEQEAKLPGGLR